MIRAFGAPQRYVQGPGVIDQLDAMARAYGAQRPFIVTDSVVRELIGPRLARALGLLAAGAVHADFNGECSAAEISRLAAIARAAGADLVVGVGGGKAIDTAKGVAIEHPVPVFIVPTIASMRSRATKKTPQRSCTRRAPRVAPRARC